MRKATPFTFYFLYFAATAALIPFIVLYYQQLGFSGGPIGLRRLRAGSGLPRSTPTCFLTCES